MAARFAIIILLILVGPGSAQAQEADRPASYESRLAGLKAAIQSDDICGVRQAIGPLSDDDKYLEKHSVDLQRRLIVSALREVEKRWRSIRKVTSASVFIFGNLLQEDPLDLGDTEWDLSSFENVTCSSGEPNNRTHDTWLEWLDQTPGFHGFDWRLLAQTVKEKKGPERLVEMLLRNAVYFAIKSLKPQVVGMLEKGDFEKAIRKYRKVVDDGPPHVNSPWYYETFAIAARAAITKSLLKGNVVAASRQFCLWIDYDTGDPRRPWRCDTAARRKGLVTAIMGHQIELCDYPKNEQAHSECAAMAKAALKSGLPELAFYFAAGAVGGWALYEPKTPRDKNEAWNANFAPRVTSEFTSMMIALAEGIGDSLWYASLTKTAPRSRHVSAPAHDIWLGQTLQSFGDPNDIPPNFWDLIPCSNQFDRYYVCLIAREEFIFAGVCIPKGKTLIYQPFKSYVMGPRNSLFSDLEDARSFHCGSVEITDLIYSIGSNWMGAKILSKDLVEGLEIETLSRIEIVGGRLSVARLSKPQTVSGMSLIAFRRNASNGHFEGVQLAEGIRVGRFALAPGFVNFDSASGCPNRFELAETVVGEGNTFPVGARVDTKTTIGQHCKEMRIESVLVGGKQIFPIAGKFPLP